MDDLADIESYLWGVIVVLTKHPEVSRTLTELSTLIDLCVN